MSSFSSVIDLMAAGFKGVIQWLRDFNLVGTFSLMDFFIAAMVIDMIITALFVTFNVDVSSSWAYDENGNRTRTIKRTRGSAHVGR